MNRRRRWQRDPESGLLLPQQQQRPRSHCDFFTCGPAYYGGSTSAPVGYVATALADSPYLMYGVTETTGTSIADLTGNGRTGTAVNLSLASMSGPLGTDQVAVFNGSSSYIVGPIVPNMNELTVEAIIYLATSGTAGGHIFADADGAGGNDLIDYVGPTYIGIRDDKNGGTIVGSGAEGVAQFSTTVSKGVWMHYASVFRRHATGSATGDVDMYLGGSLIHTFTSGPYPLNSGFHCPAGCQIGRWYDTSFSGGYFGGAICYFALYSYPLTSSQIAAHVAAI